MVSNREPKIWLSEQRSTVEDNRAMLIHIIEEDTSNCLIQPLNAQYLPESQGRFKSIFLDSFHNI